VTRARDRDDGGPTERPLRLRKSEEVTPLRLEAPLRLVEPSAADPDRFDGPALRRWREARGLSVRALAERTKLSRHRVEDIEAARVGRIAPAYLRGYLAAIAKELRLDPERVTRSYLDALRPRGDSGGAR
jgi:hypothetical protein